MFSELVCAFEEYVQFLRCSSLHIIFMNWTWILSKRQPPQKQLKQTKTKGERRKKTWKTLKSITPNQNSSSYERYSLYIAMSLKTKDSLNTNLTDIVKNR